MRRAWVRASAKARPIARMLQIRRFRSSSRCSRNPIVGSSEPGDRSLGIRCAGRSRLAGLGIGGGGCCSGGGWHGCRRGGGDRLSAVALFQGDLGLERRLQIVGGAAELADPLAEHAAELGELARSEDEQRNQENDEELGP